MHLSPAFRGLATTWETVKDSMVESFSESWSIDHANDYPYGWNGVDEGDSEDSSSDEKGAQSSIARLVVAVSPTGGIIINVAGHLGAHTLIPGVFSVKM